MPLSLALDGTKGSEGFNTTGSDLEINAFKNIIEWVNGKRKAYTDKTSNVEIKADWATGNVAMTGLSWLEQRPLVWQRQA